MIILGIESSCDDTAAAVVKNGSEILSNVVASQDRFHRRFSGVVPEIASRRHLEAVHLVVLEALEDAGVSPEQLDAIAVTNRPGLIGSLLVGISAAKGYAYSWKKPLIPVNHLNGHLYAPSFKQQMEWPLLGLIISGGHTLLVKAHSPVDIEMVGSTIDDAVGEVYDKIAKHFGLGYPGGPLLDRLAVEGDPQAYRFPRTYLNDKERHRYNFSFSGIKTAVIHQRQRFAAGVDSGADESLADIAASFQAAVADVLLNKCAKLVEESGLNRIAVSGGVAANSYLRSRFADDQRFEAYFPEPRFCTDNAAMIAGVAAHSEQLLDYRAALDLDAGSRVVERIRGDALLPGSSSSLSRPSSIRKKQ